MHEGYNHPEHHKLWKPVPWYNVGLDQDSWTFRQRNQKLILNSEVRSWNHLLQKDDNPATAFLKGSGCKTDQQKDNIVP